MRGADTSVEGLNFNKDLEFLQSIQRLEDATDDAYANDNMSLMFKLLRSRMGRLLPVLSHKEKNDEVSKAHGIILKCRAYNPQRKSYIYVEQSLVEFNDFLYEMSVEHGLHLNREASRAGVSRV